MKRPIIFAALALLAACQAQPVAANDPPAPRALGTVADMGIAVVTDAQTGCEYFYVAGSFLTPRTAQNSSNGSTTQRGCR